MANRDDELNALADSILDGRPIDWLTVESGTDEVDRGVVRQLRVLSAVAAAHRGTPTPSTRDAPARDLPLPGRWGPLEILEHIGRGSFGDVYKAWDPQLDRAVALKLLPDEGSTHATTTSSMLDEGRRLARVRHPHVVTIHGADRINGRFGLWMEYVHGQSLAQALEARERFPAAEVVRIGVSICRALAAVHEAGLLHRDIKAQNVMLESSGRIVLMDFGTGREIASAAPDLAGTPLYLAPEVLDRQPATVRSDVYSVGVLLYHLLTGTYPVSGQTVREIRESHGAGQRVPLRTARADVPESLAEVVERAIDARPDARYSTAAEMADALAAVRARAINVPFLAFAALGSAAAILAIAFFSDRLLGPRTQPSSPPATTTASSAVASPAAASPAAASPAVLPQPLPSSSADVPGRAITTLNFEARDWVLIVPFDNRTGEAVLDGTLESALEHELWNSAFVNVAPRERIEDVLQLMRRPVDTKVDARIGREIAIRDGAIRALITGRVEKIGATYVTTSQIVNPADAAVVTSLTEEASSQSDLLPAVRRQALKIRSTLGEMLRTVRDSEVALERVTTPSLHAAQLYSQAAAFMRNDGTWQVGPAQELLKQAVSEDPDFASAHILLAWATASQRRPKEEYLPPAMRAMELTNRTSDVERYFIIGSYHLLQARALGPVGDLDVDQHLPRAIAAFEALMKIKPDHYWAVGYLANLYRERQMEPQATELAARRADLRPTNLDLRWSAAQRFFERGDRARGLIHLRKAQALLTPEFVAAHPEYDATIYRLQAGEAWLRLDATRVRDLTDARARRLNDVSTADRTAAVMNQELVGVYNALGRPGDALRAAQSVPEPLRVVAVGQVLLAEAGGQMNVGSTPGAKDALLRHLMSISPNLEAIPLAPLWTASLIVVNKLSELRSGVQRAEQDGYVLYNGGRFRWMLYAAQARLALAEGKIEEALRLFQLAAENGGPGPAQDAGTPVVIANAWIARGDRDRAIAILEDVTRDRWTSSAAGTNFAGTGVRVSAWMSATHRLSELYREEGRRQEADLLDKDLAKLLAEAEPDFPLLVHLRARQQTRAR